MLKAEVDFEKRLCSSASSGTKVDIVVTTFHLPPYVTAIDVTVSCPLLPTYVVSAALDASALFDKRAAEKDAKHLPGCVDLGRAFLPFVTTTLLGIGPRTAREWLDSLFSDLFVQEIAGGGTGSDAAHRRLLFVQSLQASATRATSRMAVTLLHAARADGCAAAAAAAAAAAVAPAPAAASPAAVIAAGAAPPAPLP